MYFLCVYVFACIAWNGQLVDSPAAVSVGKNKRFGGANQRRGIAVIDPGRVRGYGGIATNKQWSKPHQSELRDRGCEEWLCWTGTLTLHQRPLVYSARAILNGHCDGDLQPWYRLCGTTYLNFQREFLHTYSRCECLSHFGDFRCDIEYFIVYIGVWCCVP